MKKIIKNGIIIAVILSGAVGLFFPIRKLMAKDRKAPDLVCVKEKTVYADEKLSPEELIISCMDESEVTFSFKEIPDLKSTGRQSVTVEAKDAGGNMSESVVNLDIYPVRKKVSAEAGGSLPAPEEFLREDLKGSGEETTVDYEEEIDYTVPGEYAGVVTYSGKEYPVTLCIEDTKAPLVFSFKRQEYFQFGEAKPEDFIHMVLDISPVTYRFIQAPDMAVQGLQSVSVEIADSSGNTSVVYAAANVKMDIEPPEIHGIKDKIVCIGEGIAYKAGVTVTDNSNAECTLRVDAEEVNPDAEGDYSVTYYAEDPSGNISTRVITLSVVKPMYEAATAENIETMADEVLQEIITDGMSDYDKVSAVFNWVRTNVFYTDTTTYMNGYLQSAYIAFTQRSGNCYEFRSISEALLTRAGIENMEINRAVEGSSMRHFWNLVKIDGQWYHFDTTPRLDDVVVFCWTDTQLQEYSDANYQAYGFDRADYPEIAK